MANERQFKWKTKFIATRGVKEYRETIPVWVNKNDVVLEIGCEWGTTTALIAPRCKEVIGTDVSPEAIIIKSGALKHFASQCIAWWSPQRTKRSHETSCPRAV